MGLFDTQDEEDIILENADLDCEHQNEFVSKKEVKKIDEHLEPGEAVHFLATGTGLKIDGEQKSAMAVLTAATDRRVVYKLTKLVGSSQTSIYYRDISSVEVSFGMVQKRLKLETNSVVFDIAVSQLGKDEVKDMSQFIREKMGESSRADSSENKQTGNVDTDDDPLDKLERLGELRDNGVITEEEFQEKKQSLLDQI